MNETVFVSLDPGMRAGEWGLQAKEVHRPDRSHHDAGRSNCSWSILMCAGEDPPKTCQVC